MELKKPAVAGTLESSDVQITLRPNAGQGIQIELESDVKTMFGEAIEQTVRSVLEEFQVRDAWVGIQDKGALDFAIRARMQCALCRALEIRYDWGREDVHGQA
ncbi:MAG: citrate lyase acyl carrier protein [Oscillospiraceae bacterium]|nr:citrate lyase acyl carrier protein [Oscillospiraceae bacterium]